MHLDGPIRLYTFPTQIVKLLALTPSKKKAEIELNPAEVAFPRGRTYTDWKTSQEMRVSLQVEISEKQKERLLFRWNLKASIKDSFETQLRLVLEALVIPSPQVTLDSMQTHQRELVSGPGAPVFTILEMKKPIKWIQV